MRLRLPMSLLLLLRGEDRMRVGVGRWLRRGIGVRRRLLRGGPHSPPRRRLPSGRWNPLLLLHDDSSSPVDRVVRRLLLRLRLRCADASRRCRRTRLAASLPPPSRGSTPTATPLALILPLLVLVLLLRLLLGVLVAVGRRRRTRLAAATGLARPTTFGIECAGAAFLLGLWAVGV